MMPNLLVRSERGALPNSPHVVIPMARSFSSVWDPMPQSFFTGSASRTDATGFLAYPTETIGFGEVAGELGDKDIGSDAHGAGNTQFVFYRSLDGRGPGSRGR